MIHRIQGIIPLDSQIGVLRKKSVADGLKAALFADFEPAAGSAETLHTYALLDAAKLPSFVEALEPSGLEARCLFKGETLENLGSVAPWIVKLDEDNAFCRNLFTKGNAPWQHWERAAGIFVRSRGGIDDVQAHFRHFVRVQHDEGGWYYFRFWEPAAAAVYFPGLIDRPEVARRWFQPRRGRPIERMIVIDPSVALTEAIVLEPVALDEVKDAPGIRLLRSEDIASMSVARVDADAAALAVELERMFGADLPLAGTALKKAVREALDRFLNSGFIQRDNLFVMLAWEIFFGPGFEKLDPDGQLDGIMRSGLDEAERFDMLKQRMERLG